MQITTLGRYEIVKELGRGAMGRVFLARDPQIQRNVALKTVQIFSALPESEQAEARERFLREVRAAGKLLHPGIVTLFDVGEAEGVLYLAMEWIEGPTLDPFCRADKLLPVETVAEMVAGVAEALDYAHASGVIHRDVKPANMMQAEGSLAKIMDFGLARASEDRVTTDGTLLGTPSFMSPEQIRGEPLDGRSDLFSLGAVLFGLLTGEKAFPGDTIPSTIYRIVHEAPRVGSETHARVTPELDAFLETALAKNPEDRWATGEAFAAALRAAAGTASAVEASAVSLPGAPRAESESRLPPPSSSRRRRTSPLPYVGALLLVITLLGIAVWNWRDRLGLFAPREPETIWWETTVRTEPPGLEVQLDGVPLDPAEDGLLRFASTAPFGVLSVAAGCRNVERQLDPADAGGEVVLLVDPAEYTGHLDPSTGAAMVHLNGQRGGATPLDLQLDLCRENTLRVEAHGFHPAELTIPAEATPMEVRTLLAGIALEPIPMGRLALPESSLPMVYYVDGRRLQETERELDLPEGEHEIRFKNEGYWIDERRTIVVTSGTETTPSLDPPALTTLVVQAYPANCKVYLRRPGGSWRYVDDTPARRRLAVGRYEVRVELNATGETREQAIELVAGDNPPVRVSFGRRS